MRGSDAAHSANRVSDIDRPRVDEESAAQTAGDDSDLEVFVNCTPNGACTSLWPYIDSICASLAKRYCVDANGNPTTQDIRCAPNDSVIGYMKWKGALSAIVLECPPPDDTYVLHTGGDERGEIVARAMETLCFNRNALFARGPR